MGFNLRAIFKIIGILTLIEGICMVPALISALHFEEWQSGGALLETSIICVCVGFIILTQLKFDKIKLHHRESYFIACISWIYVSILGAIPLYYCGADFPFSACLFESVAGFTTTGCSVLNADLMPKSMLLWRATCHWVGGMGILVLLIAIFPLWGINNQSIAIAETPGLHNDKINARYADTGKFLYISYATMSLAEFILLTIGPMDWFTALLTTFSSISTAGLIVTTETSWLFSLVSVRFIVLIFTILSSMNFIVYIMILDGRWKEAFKNLEVRWFIKIIVIASCLVALSLRVSGSYSSLWQAFKDATCQVVSFISTSGFYVCDYTNWPSFTITILFLLLFVGGCTYSTSGSLKVIRIVIFFKMMRRGLLKQIHPRIVKAIMLDDKPLSAKSASAVTMHIMLYIGILAIGCILLSFNNLSMETTFTTALGMFTNTGVALNGAGNFGYFGMFNGFSQIVMAFLMVAGRLEMYAIVILFAKSFWKPHQANAI